MSNRLFAQSSLPFAVVALCLVSAFFPDALTEGSQLKKPAKPKPSKTSKPPASPEPKPAAKTIRFDLGLPGLTFELPSMPPLVQHDEKTDLGELRFYHKPYGGLDWFGGSFVLKPDAKLDVVRQAKVNVSNVFRQLDLPEPESLMQNKQPLGKAESAIVFGESLTDKGEVLAACRFVKQDRKVWYVLMSWKAADDKSAKLSLAIVNSARLDK